MSTPYDDILRERGYLGFALNPRISLHECYPDNLVYYQAVRYSEQLRFEAWVYNRALLLAELSSSGAVAPLPK